MSGAFHKFSGLSNVNPAKYKQRSAKHLVGEPCIYNNHFNPDAGFRTSDCGSCVECSKSSPTLNLDLSRIRGEVLRRALRFWSKVDITDIDDCWKYTECRDKPTLLHFWRRPELKGGYSHHPIRIAIWLSWGDFGNDATQSLCGERRCCNPLHNLPASIPANSVQQVDRELLQEQVDALQRELVAYYRRLNKLDEPEPDNDLSRHSFEGFHLLSESDTEQEMSLSPLQVAIDKTLFQLKRGNHSSQINV